MAISGIYLLKEGNQVVYVGQTINVYRRLDQHCTDKQFSEVYFKELPKALLNIEEQRIIEKYTPVLNIQFRGDSKIDKARREAATFKDLDLLLEADGFSSWGDWGTPDATAFAFGPFRVSQNEPVHKVLTRFSRLCDEDLKTFIYLAEGFMTKQINLCGFTKYKHLQQLVDHLKVTIK